MEFFYKTPLTQKLIDLDDRGKYQEKVVLFEAMSYGENLVEVLKKNPLDPRFTRTRVSKIAMIHDIVRRVGLIGTERYKGSGYLYLRA